MLMRIMMKKIITFDEEFLNNNIIIKVKTVIDI